jgi:hypothetical protein
MEGERRKFQYEFKDGAVYDGTWLDAKFDGVGKQSYADKVHGTDGHAKHRVMDVRPSRIAHAAAMP